jgi:chromosome segregation ATPase
MAASPKEIATALQKQEQRVTQLKAQAASLNAENGLLRTEAKRAADLEAKLAKAQAQAKDDAKAKAAAEQRADQLTADLAQASAKIARLEKIHQLVEEHEQAAQEVEKLLKAAT